MFHGGWTCCVFLLNQNECYHIVMICWITMFICWHKLKVIKVIINDWALITSLQYWYHLGNIYWDMLILIPISVTAKLLLLGNSHGSLTNPLRQCVLLNTLVTSCCFFFFFVVSVLLLARILSMPCCGCGTYLWKWLTSVHCRRHLYIYNGTSTCNIPITLLRRVLGSNNQTCHRQMLMMALLG